MTEYEMLKKALDICLNKHSGQVDKSGKEYFIHPVTVALLCDTTKEKIVALLHDVIEDTDYTFTDLKNDGFSQEIIDAIRAVTKNDDITYQEYISNIKNNPIARKVKLNDLKHNSDLSRLENPTDQDLKRTKKYLESIHFLEN